MFKEEIESFYAEKEIKVKGTACQKPMLNFEEGNFPGLTCLCKKDLLLLLLLLSPTPSDNTE